MEQQYSPHNGSPSGFGAAPALESVELADAIPQAVNPYEIDREATRYIFFAGDILPVSQKRERSDLRMGGEYYGQQYKTLIRSRGLLRRCQITPMEVGYDFMSDEMVGDDPKLQVVMTVDHADPAGGGLRNKLNAIQIYPGDEIKSILTGARNVEIDKGVRELTQLQGVPYADFKSSQLQEYVFPEWDKITGGYAALPVKLSELELHLRGRINDTADTSIKGIIEQMLLSCEQFRTWGTNYLKRMSSLVRLPANQGFVHTYSELAESLFEQLEIRREDMLSSDRDIADIVSRAQTGNNFSSNEMLAVLNKFAENQTLLTQMIAGQQGVPVVQPIPSVPTIENIPNGNITTTTATPEPTISTEARCEGTKADGEPCGAHPVEGSRYCRHHGDDK